MTFDPLKAFDFSGDAANNRCVVRSVLDNQQCPETAMYVVEQNALTDRSVCKSCLPPVLDLLAKRDAVRVRKIAVKSENSFNYNPVAGRDAFVKDFEEWGRRR